MFYIFIFCRNKLTKKRKKGARLTMPSKKSARITGKSILRESKKEGVDLDFSITEQVIKSSMSKKPKEQETTPAQIRHLNEFTLKQINYKRNSAFEIGFLNFIFFHDLISLFGNG